MSQDTVTLTAACLCRTHSFSAVIPKTDLPLQATACHCTSCRHATGSLLTTAPTWPQPRQDVDVSKLKTYNFSANLTSRFCGTCSSLMFSESREDPDKLWVCTGVLKNIDADLVKITKHIFVDDTVDGGASYWYRMPNADGQEVPRYRGWSEPMSWDLTPTKISTRSKEAGEKHEPVPITCHCKGINLVFHPGRYDAMEASDLPRYVDPKTRKPIGGFDACDSCRLQVGSDIVNWTFFDLGDITRPEGAAYPDTMYDLKAAVDAGDAVVGSLACYQSSEKVLRFFCGKCAATVFYATESRPTIVDVPVGLLETKDGARAESVLAWCYGEDPSHVVDVMGGWREGLVSRVQAGSEEYRIAANYPKSYRRLAKEAREASS